MYKLNYVSKNPDVSFIEKYCGGYNDLPPGMKEISLEDVAKGNFLQCAPKYVEPRSLYRGDLERYGLKERDALTLYHFQLGSGFAVNSDWVEKTIRFFTFDCFTLLMEDFQNLPIDKDSGWRLNETTSRPMSGLRNYERVIKFGRKLNDGAMEMELVMEVLNRDECPGYGGVGMRGSGLVYKFFSSVDSGD